MSAGGSGSGFDWVLSWRLRQVLTLQDVAKGFISCAVGRWGILNDGTWACYVSLQTSYLEVSLELDALDER